MEKKSSQDLASLGSRGSMSTGGTSKRKINLMNQENEWNKSSKKPLLSFKEHVGPVQCVAFNPCDQNKLYTGSHDKTLKIWDLEKQACAGTINAHNEGVWTLSASFDGTQALTGSADKTVVLWDLKSNKAIKKYDDHKDLIHWVQFSEDNKVFASSGQKDDHSEVIVYDFAKSAEIARIKNDAPIVYQIDFQKDGSFFATCDINGGLNLYDQNNFQLLSEIKCKAQGGYYNNATTNYCHGCTLDVDQKDKPHKPMFVCYSDGHVREFAYNKELNKIETVSKFKAHTASVTSMRANEDSDYIVTTSKDNCGRVWDSQSCQFVTTLLGHNAQVACSDLVVVEETGKNMIATGSWDHKLNIYII